MANVVDYLPEDQILTDLAAAEKFTAIEEMVHFLKKKKLVADPDDALDLLRQREEIYSTGIGRALAVPHALSKKMEKTVLCFAFKKDGIPFESIDQAPVHFIFLLLGPEENQRLHLQILAKIARLFRDKDLREELLGVRSAKSLRDTLAKYEKNLDA
jgi:nitrogen PTS system EIIA component